MHKVRDKKRKSDENKVSELYDPLPKTENFYF